MAFDLLGARQSPSLYPLYSDIDSDIESNNNNDHSNINLMVPASIRRERYPNNNNNKAKLSKTYNYYRSMQNRNRGRGRNRIYRNNHYKTAYNKKSNRDNQYHNKRRRNRHRHHPKSASLSAISIISSPRPNGCIPVSDQEFVYHLTQNRASFSGHKTKSNPNPTHQNHQNHQNKQNLNTKRSQKRRIRTFYSKKWGNRLYNLHKSRNNNICNDKVPQTIRSHSCDIPDMLRVDRYHQHQQYHQLHRKSTPDINNSQLQLWRTEIDDARKSLSAFIEEENLDLNEIKSVKSVSPSPSPSPSPSISASPMPIHLDVNDFRIDQDSQTVYYDSAASNIASNSDTDSEGDGDDDDDDDEEEEDQMDEIECTPSPDPNPNVIIRDFTPTPAPNININRNNNNIGYSNNHNNHNNHSNHSHVTISRYHEIDNEKPSNFKIIVSAPNNEEIINTNCNHLSSQVMNTMNTMNTMNDRQNELMSRLKPKRSRRRYIPSVIESGASDDCSSCDDDDMTSTAGTGNEMDGGDRDNLYSKSSLFLSENNLKRGVYSSFGLSDTETDYLSAQSDDFDELTICYHHRNDQDNHRNNHNLNINHHDKNIRFRNNQMMYLSDIGPSDIGSSDTECFSSNDSIPDSIPPPLNNDDDDDNDTDDDFVSIN